VAKALTGSAQIFFTDYLFHPIGTGLEVQPLTLLQTVPATILTLPFGSVVSYNLLAVSSFWFAGYLAATWIQRITKDEVAALVGGSIFAFAPYHFTYLPQLNLLVVGVVPLYLLAAHSLESRPVIGRAILAGVALAAVSLASWYYGVAVTILALFMSGARIARPQANSISRQVRLEAVHWLSFLVLIAPVVLRLAPAFLGTEIAEEETISGMALIMKDFKFTTTTISLWSYAGITALVLAAIGSWKNKRSLPLLVIFFGFLILSLGSSVRLGGLQVPLPYALMEKVPVLGAFRYPDRFFVVAQLALAGLAAFGVLRLRVWGKRFTRQALIAISGFALVLPLAEFWPGTIPSVPDPSFVPVPHAESEKPGALFHVPVAFRHVDAELMLHQLEHERPITGGYLTRYNKDETDRVAMNPDLMPMFIGPIRIAFPPNLASRLRRHGFTYVCVQKRPAIQGYEWQTCRIYGPFSLSAHTYLKQRLYPKYFPVDLDRPIAEAWIEQLTNVLGPPIRENSLAAVFDLRR
jgi:hypothetical protein